MATTDVAERVSALVEPLLRARGAQLYDVVAGGATLQVLVGGGIDLDALAALTREISTVLDDADPMPGSYTLEVSTPGLERTLRTPQHFTGAIGERVKVKTTPDNEVRRVDGILTDADDEGFVVDTETGARRVAYGDVERARTVFEWGTSSSKTEKGQRR